ncbi:sensor histidine kinase [Metabacillus malikii]|uniref:histidine kinase n=1 Tax=Metabacillus malikii TaxID=1504265 RepID=A0ABT9ZCQ6_9BACI|nr:HAMP domain-containing sensor histidine kinase [Metabacillus malikii]MDQ0230051.1 signal transduction histidine kinase [Metabacillus malikii]
MFRSRENQIMAFSMISFTVLAVCIAAFTMSKNAALFTFITLIIIISICFYYTSRRYRELYKLSHYLQRISNGDYTLDIRDNEEGELSILKNNIYTVTRMLAEQQSLLKRDKLQLTDAISDISHQLKTPLTSMMVMADLLSDANLNEVKRAEFTKNIRMQLERIEWLVSSLLKLSKIDAGTIVFKKEKVNVKRAIERAIEPVLIPIDIKQQNLQVKIEEDNITFTGDANWAIEAFINILKNCVEHTADFGKITVTATENPLFTEIIISDNGTGIPKKDLPHIFKRFYKGTNTSEDSVGIGLAMSYSIISSQNGDIEVKSKEGVGTTFLIKFYKQVI